MNRKRSRAKVDRKMPMIHPNAAAIDVGATMHMAAVGADRTPEPVRSFGTFTIAYCLTCRKNCEGLSMKGMLGRR